jgi:PAS domain S-box-containing protein
MIWLSGTDKLCTWFNQQWLQFTGRTIEQELGNGWAENVHEDDFDRCLKTYVEAFDARQPFIMEYRLRRRDREWRWLLDHGVPIYKAEDFAGYIGSCIDVTLQKEAENALREREDQLEAVISRTPFMLTLCSRDLRYRFVSRAYANMIGRKPAEVEGKTIAEIMGAKGFQTILPYVEKVLAGQLVEYETGVHFEGVGVRSLRVVYTPQEDEEGNVHGWIASIVDITDRKQAEQALREALKTKDRFLASISHELRTPLTPVLLAVDMLQQNKTLAQPVKSALDVIRRNVRLEAKLVNDLLDVSRASNGQFRLELSECDVHEIVQRAMRVCFDASNGNELRILTKLNATHRNCPGDATRLQQVFWNLIENAIRSTSPAGSITISSRNDNGNVCVEVSDTGCGIEPAKLERIFEPFTAGNDGVSGYGGRRGFGLGLFIARQIVVAHGGTVVATSEGVNRGATFTVSLPASPEQQHLWR